jgi:hypothetical protein
VKFYCDDIYGAKMIRINSITLKIAEEKSLVK